jgi:hypothetical protein
MFLYHKLRATFLTYYLLAIAASIIVLSVIGSINIMFINMGGNDGTAVFEMIIVTFASMGFLFAALAQLKPTTVFNYLVWGLLIQIVFMILKTSIGF